MAGTTKISLKLLVDVKGERVLFAEAGKDFVDFLFNIMALPVGTVVRLLNKEGTVGCLGNLYDSIETLADNYMQQTANKDTLLKPILSSASNVPLLLPNIQPSTASNFYSCSSRGYRDCRDYISNDPKSTCPRRNHVMNRPVSFVNPEASKASSSDEGGYVKGVVTYMIMDDLVVRPMSTISSITMLNKFNVKDVGGLEEKVIDVGMDLGVKLLKASMQSKTALTDVFLGRKVWK